MKVGASRKEIRGDGPLTVVVSEAFASREFPDGNAIGNRLRVGPVGAPGPWSLIVGVVGDIVHSWIDRTPQPIVYQAVAQAPTSWFTVAMRTPGSPEAMVPSIRAVIQDLDAELPVAQVLTYDQVIANSMIGLEMVAWMMGIAGLIAFSLATIGVYSVMSYAADERAHEIGIRMALGASSGDVWYR